MKNAFLLTFAVLLFFAGPSRAQVKHGDSAVRTTRDSVATVHTAGTTQDDAGDMFLLFYGIAIIGIAVAAVLVGAAVMVGFLVVLFALVSAGVLSTGILVGMYRRSAAAGFRTLLVILCGLAGLFTGAVGLWLVGRIFTLHWKAQTALLSGAVGGLIGGMALGLVLFFIINSFFRYCKRRLAF